MYCAQNVFHKLVKLFVKKQLKKKCKPTHDLNELEHGFVILNRGLASCATCWLTEKTSISHPVAGGSFFP